MNRKFSIRPAITLKGKTRPVRVYAPARTAAGVPA